MGEQVDGPLGCFQGVECIGIGKSDTVAALKARFLTATGRTLRDLHFRGVKLQHDSIIWHYLPDFYGKDSSSSSSGESVTLLPHPRFAATILPGSVQLLINVAAITDKAVQVELSAAPSDTIGDVAVRLQAETGLDYKLVLRSHKGTFLEDTSTLEHCYGAELIPWESKVRLSALRADVELRIALGQRSHGGARRAGAASAVPPSAAMATITMVAHPGEHVRAVEERASRAFFPDGAPPDEWHSFRNGDSTNFFQNNSLLHDLRREVYDGAQLVLRRNVDVGGRVHVNTLTAKIIVLEAVMARTLVHEVKQTIQRTEGFPPEQQRLIWSGKELKDSRSLRQHFMFPGPDNIHPPTLQLIPRLRGGGSLSGGMFADVADANGISRIAFSETAPEWRIACEGLNIEGLCSNAECAAHGQMVIHKIGMGAFALGGACACPLCVAPIVPLTCAFHRCVWMFEGVKADGGASLSTAWREAGDSYERFNTGTEGTSSGAMVEWERFMLIAKGRKFTCARAADTEDASSKSGERAGATAAAPASSSGTQLDDCAVCLEPLRTRRAPFVKTPCGHLYHKACLTAWQRCSSAGSGRCPMCRADLCVLRIGEAD